MADDFASELPFDLLDAVDNLSFDEDGWITGDEGEHGFPFQLAHAECKRFLKGMHPFINENFGGKLQGIITHYDALPNAERTVKGFCKTDKGASTHFVIDRNGDIFQLISLHNRAQHAAIKEGEWPTHQGRFPMANGRSTAAPNHWFVGVDLSNLGPLKKQGKDFVSHLGTLVKREAAEEITHGPQKGSWWEAYTDEQLQSYFSLMCAIVNTLGIDKAMNYRHSQVSPTRKQDPGPAFPFEQMIDLIYTTLARWDNYCISSDGERSDNEFNDSMV
jgi:N-acetyl-anhydromuramyl-L-alanine amidase AmpD